MTYDHLLKSFDAWTQTQRDIRSVMVVGSQVRTDHPADGWADLDFIIYAVNPKCFLKDSAWISNIGDVWAKTPNFIPSGDPEWLVTFAGGLDVDFVFSSYRKYNWLVRFLWLANKFPRLLNILPGDLAQLLNDGRKALARIFDRGVRVVVDKKGFIERERRALGQASSPKPPTAAEFRKVVQRYLCLVERTARKVRRGELFVALFGPVNALMLPMFEWHAKVTHGWNYDTWHAGRFLEEWADPRVIAGLRTAFAHYDREDLSRSLLASLDLFHWVAKETADKLNFQFQCQPKNICPNG